MNKQFEKKISLYKRIQELDKEIIKIEKMAIKSSKEDAVFTATINEVKKPKEETYLEKEKKEYNYPTFTFSLFGETKVNTSVNVNHIDNKLELTPEVILLFLEIYTIAQVGTKRKTRINN